MKQQDSRRYPIGNFEYGKSYTLDATRKNIKTIARLPKDLKRILRKLDTDELDLSYREGGWTVRQIVHHLADSHVNAYVRMKLAVTEQTPIIKPYEEQLWAETEDGKRGGMKMSYRLLAALHRRWVAFMESLNEDDLERGYFHPATKRIVMLPEAIALYAWHCRHHLEHIRIVVSGQGVAVSDMPAMAAEASAPAQRRGAQVIAAPSEKPRRIRRSAEQIAADKAAKAAQPKLSRAEILAKARAARSTKSAATTKSEAPKRTRRTKEQMAADRAAAAQPKMTRAEALAKARAARSAGRNVQGTAKAAASTAGAPRRTRRTKDQMAAARAAATAQPKMTRAEALARARAARAANKGAVKSKAPAKSAGQGSDSLSKVRAERAAARAAKHKGVAGTNPLHADIKARSAKAATAPIRRRRSPEEVAAEKAAKAAAPKLSRAEIMAKARAARQANVAAKPAATAASDKPKRVRRTAEQIAADKAAAAAKPKLSRGEALARARAARAANAAGKNAQPAAKAGKAKPAKQSASQQSGEQAAAKRQGMSAEHMARIRAMRSAGGTAKSAKPAADPNAPKLSRAEILAKARAARAAKSPAGSTSAKPAKPAAEGEKSKRKGMSPEHMARIREMRMAKRDKK